MICSMKNFLFALYLLSSSAMVAQAPSGDLIIRNGTVLTITKGTLEETDILVQKGKITGLGKNLKAPAGIKEIDATGQYIMPMDP